MPAAKHMPRIRAVLFLDKLLRIATFAGVLGGLFFVFDLMDGKDVLPEFTACTAVAAVSVAGMVLTRKSRSRALSRDVAALPSGVRRDLPYGAEERDGAVGFPATVSFVLFLVLLGCGFAGLGVYGFLTEDVGAPAVAASMGSVAAIFFGLAWMLHGVRYSVDAHGVTCRRLPKSVTPWSSVPEFHVSSTAVTLSGPDRGKPRLNLVAAFLEISAKDLAATLVKVRDGEVELRDRGS